LKNHKILLVDDDIKICQLIKEALEPENIETITAFSGKEAHNFINSEIFDLIILDIMLEDTDGFQLLKEIQIEKIDTPIIFLSGKHQDYDKILALGMGADDYITKPFSLSVLIARVKAHLRRGDRAKDIQLSSKKIIKDPFILNLDTYQMFKNGKEIFLSAKEVKIMKFFMENPNIVFTRDQLYEKIWSDVFIDNNSVTVYMLNLRKKIEDDPKNPKYLQTVWGIGYKFCI
jgi:DNA-binding response OmpR family regulator